MKTHLAWMIALLVSLSNIPALAANPLVGEWGLTIPNGAAGWLGVTEKDGKVEASLLWGGGSVLPMNDVKMEGEALVIRRVTKSKPKDPSAKPVETIETLTFKVDGDTLKGTTVKTRGDKEFGKKEEFTGKRTPPLPPAPDLSKVKFGEPIALFNGKDLTGWKLTNPKAKNGWSVKDGLLVNDVTHGGGFGNLRTDREFEDFNVKVEVLVGKDENSGVYLRGIYECQVVDSYGKPIDPHNMGAIYSRITPTESAEKPAGEWQTMDITLVDRHATVILNGKRIIDNQPILGCTGGALWSDPTKPGPIYLQGDHTGITYRSIVLRPVVR